MIFHMFSLKLLSMLAMMAAIFASVWISHRLLDFL